MKKVILSPYLWIIIIYLISMFTLEQGIYHLFYYTGIHLNSGTYDSYIEYKKSEIKLQDYAILTAQLIRFVSIALLVFKTKLFVPRKLNIKKRDFLTAIYCFLINTGVTIIAGVLLYLMGLGSETNTVSGNQDNVKDFLDSSFVMASISAVILGPIIEEFIFRKLIMGHIFRNYKYTGWVISSVLFGSLHLLSGFSILGLITYMTLAFMFGWVYIKTERIEASIIVHVFNNFVSVLVMLLMI